MCLCVCVCPQAKAVGNLIQSNWNWLTIELISIPDSSTDEITRSLLIVPSIGLVWPSLLTNDRMYDSMNTQTINEYMILSLRRALELGEDRWMVLHVSSSYRRASIKVEPQTKMLCANPIK